MKREEKQKVLRFTLTEKQKRSLKGGNEDLYEFLRRTREWRNSPSSNDRCILR
jgi:hypothetical protein